MHASQRCRQVSACYYIIRHRQCVIMLLVCSLVRETSPSRNGVLLTRSAGNKFCLYVEGNIGQDRPTPDLPEENFVGSSSQSADRFVCLVFFFQQNNNFKLTK